MCAIGSAIESIYVMIDTSRLSHSLATALKDRPHGIPVQPNRSLPLRPPPPLPSRLSLAKSQKNSPIRELISAAKSPKKSSDVPSHGEKNSEGDDMPNIETVGINFYDSKETEENQADKSLANSTRHMLKELVKKRQRKSLDNEKSAEESGGSPTRRKSFDYGTIRCNGDSSGLKKSRATEIIESSAKRRKLLTTEESSVDFCAQPESTNMRQSAAVRSTSASDGGTEESAMKPKNVNEEEDTDDNFPIIYKYRDSSAISVVSTRKNTNFTTANTDATLNREQTSTNTNKPILPKSDNIPTCPVNKAIDIAQAVNHKNLRNDDSISLIKPNNNTATKGNLDSNVIGEIENILPSMPNLEDMMAEDLHDSLECSKNQVNVRNSEVNGVERSVPVTGTGVLESSDDLMCKLNNLAGSETLEETMERMCGERNGNESIGNVTTVLKIQIPGRSPELIVVTTPQLFTGNQSDDVGNDTLTETTKSMSLSSSVKPPLEIEDTNSVKKSPEQIQDPATVSSTDASALPDDSEPRGQDLTGKDQPRYVLQHKSLMEYEILINDNFSSPPVNETSQTCEEDEIATNYRIIEKPNEDKGKYKKSSYISELQVLHKEQSHLKYQLTLISDPIRLKRMQQKLNCTAKKIENLQKQLKMVASTKYPRANPLASRIKVRDDLVQRTASSESGENALPNDEEDSDSIETCPSISHPYVINISETDSASSEDEETDVNDAASSDYAKPNGELSTDMKFEPPDTDDAENLKLSYNPNKDLAEVGPTVADKFNQRKTQDVRVSPATVNLNPESTNNNVEYLNKNLPQISETIRPRSNYTVKSIPPLIRDRGNLSPRNLNDFNKERPPDREHGALNLTLTADRFDNERRKINCHCSLCRQSNPVMLAENTARIDGNNVGPTGANVSRNPTVLRHATAPANANVHPVPNYPVHRPDYGKTETVPSMFSRDNGGANINLSSPLQGHSALPPPYYMQLTAQGFPIPAESSPNQTTQWLGQHPQSKSSTQYTPDQDGSAQVSILGSHRLKPETQDTAKRSNPMKPAGYPQSKDASKTSPLNHPVVNKNITEQFPTLGNWAAQMTRESGIQKPLNNSTPVQNITHPTNDHRYKAQYTMAAKAFDPRHSSPTGATVHWAPGYSWPEQLRTAQPRPVQVYPNQITNLHPHRRDYPPNPQNLQNCHNMPPPCPGSDVYGAYPTQTCHQVVTRPQTNRSTEYSDHQSFHSQQTPRHYYSHAPVKRSALPAAYANQGNPGQMGNPIAMMSQFHPHQSSPYVRAAMISQWQSANNYQKNYSNQLCNGYSAETRPVNDSMGYAKANKNQQPAVQQLQKQYQQREVAMRDHLISNDKVHSPIYNLPPGLNNDYTQDVRNAEPIDMGRSYTVAPHLVKVHRSPGRTSALQCSHCGMVGPKFNCNSCETAFYCNGYCQAQHWNIHYLECSKKMPKLKKVS